MEKIEVFGAREHNLKNIDVTIPRNSLTVITGLSGSGKSSLAFDTIYAEGQRRYMETLSSYARQFVGTMERPDVDKITGLSPVVAIEQKTTNKNPRSTVGTVTEISDFLRLLYAKAATAYSMATGEKMVHYSDKEIVELIRKHFDGRSIAVMAPLVKGRKGHYRELFETLLKKGYLYARIDGKIEELYGGMKLDRYKIHDIELVVDRLIVKEGIGERLTKSLDEAMRQGKGTIMVADYDSGETRYYSRNLMCPTTGISYNEPAPHTFSFNSPHGACPRCNGLGEEVVYDIDKIIPDKKKSIREGAIEPLGKYKNNYTFAIIESLARKYGFSLDEPVAALDDAAVNAVLNGDGEPVRVESKALGLIGGTQFLPWNGIAEYIEKSVEDDLNSKGNKWKEQFVRHQTCSLCNGTRLKQESLFFKIDGKHIGEVAQMSISRLLEWVETLEGKLNKKEQAIAHEILKEITERLKFLIDVGLGYLSLARSSSSLSGGESQRIRLATQIGSKLVNVLYILDEPSIGLHQRDNRKLINSLTQLKDLGNSVMFHHNDRVPQILQLHQRDNRKLINSLTQLKDLGNSVIVVEHDEDMIRSADWIVDVGPAAGVHGGKVVACGTLDDILKSDTVTAEYMSHRKEILIPARRREGNGKKIKISGAKGNNLKNVTVEFPLGCMICVTGVSGSGKSTLVNETLRPAISQKLYKSYEQPLPYESIEGLEHIDKMVVVDQSPIGRTPRSNPATYTNLFADIRKLFESTTDAKIRGFKAGRFSFNMKGGRCEECKGAGVQTIEMNFLPDVYVTCKSCNGARYNRETLQVKFKGKNISEVLNMTVSQALEFFESIPSVRQRLQAIEDVGLGYLTLGQPSTTLSGGESQRIKLAAELSKRDTGKTLYILDEPTTGLHFEDVRVLLDVLQRLVEKGNTVVVIEHNLDVVKVADYLIDIGKEGGEYGGEIICTGTPEQVAECSESYTGQELKRIFEKLHTETSGLEENEKVKKRKNRGKK